MQRYQVVVNGNTYSVTVKSIVGNTAIVDVDGWEFQVAIGEDEDFAGDFGGIVAAAGGATAGMQTVNKPLKSRPSAAPGSTTKKRASALEALGPRKAKVPTLSGKGVVAAHLPGQIVEIAVKVGDTVKKGDVVGKMEAMKMVNEVLATIDGTIMEILVKEKQNVLENQPLMIIE